MSKIATLLDNRLRLYHYTSAEGLLSILEQQLLRASDTAFLNDRQELVYAADGLISRMNEYEKSSLDSGDDNQAALVGSARDTIKRFMHLDSDMPEANPRQYLDGATYVACFCEEHDQLGQWRAYGQSGYAIGFWAGAIQGGYAGVKKVRYGDDGLNWLSGEVIKYFETAEVKHPPGMRGYLDALNLCMPLLPTVKHDAFAQEAEWRVILSTYAGLGTPDIKVRPYPRLTPFVELPFERSAIAEIVIGPGGDFHSERAVRMALKSYGYGVDEVKIRQSRAPFRG